MRLDNARSPPLVCIQACGPQRILKKSVDMSDWAARVFYMGAKMLGNLSGTFDAARTVRASPSLTPQNADTSYNQI